MMKISLTAPSGLAASKLLLCSGSALILAMTASAAQAQCASTASAGSNRGFNATVQQNTVVSGVQSLVSVLTTQNTAFLTQTSGFVAAPNNPPVDTPGGGVWTRGVGGTFDTRTPGTYAIGASPALAAGGGTGQFGACDVRTFQDYAGFQAGADISRLNIHGFNIHGGVTVGYTESSVRSNGSFRADFQTPFIGLYGAVTKGNFFADGQIRWDFFQGVLNDPQSTLTNQRLDARSLSLTGNVGYQFPLADGWFVEPSAGAVYAQVKVDGLQTIGGFVTDPLGPNPSAPLTTKIRDFESILARGSLRVGKNIVVGDYALQPFITASVISEFAAPVRTDIAGNFGSLGAGLAGDPGRALLEPFDTRGRLNTGRIGTYGQFSGGIAGQILNTGWLGYVRGDYRTGDRVDGWGVSGGFRYQFTPETVARAVISKDAPAAAVVAEAPVTWTAISIGASAGGLWSQTEQTKVASFVPLTFNAVYPHAAGVYGGGQIGADYQIGRFVVGVAGDAGFTNARGGSNCAADFAGNIYNCQTNITDLFMATARVGFALDRTLFYVKGGAAFADTTDKQQRNIGLQTFSPLLGLDVFLVPSSKVRDSAFGWTLGAGFEYAITRNWSAKAEYMHVELDRRRYAFGTPANIAFTQAQHVGDIVKVGVNYRFVFEPAVVAPTVVAKY